MVEQQSMEITLAQLAKRVDDQARFTRSVTVVCTLAILGLNFYVLTEMFTSLPSLFIIQYMSNLEKIVQEWKLIETQPRIKDIGNHQPKTPAAETTK